MFQLHRRAPGLSAYRILFWWTFMIWVMRTLLRIFYRYKSSGKELIPKTGPLIFIANHQSNFDPPIVGVESTDRPFKGIARITLFKSKILTAYISGFGYIPIKRGESDTSAIRKALEELAVGRCVMLFPEGTRSTDGEMGTFQRGFWLLLKKSKATVVPIGIDGAFDIYPIGGKPKLRGYIESKVGEPIAADLLLAMGEEAGTAHARLRVESLMLQCRSNIAARSSKA
jgi:1-acyl-sn-glycerol-3-phosphate acyltransferase